MNEDEYKAYIEAIQAEVKNLHILISAKLNDLPQKELSLAILSSFSVELMMICIEGAFKSDVSRNMCNSYINHITSSIQNVLHHLNKNEPVPPQ